MADSKCSHDLLVPPAMKVKKLNLARWYEGDCQTPGATKSLVPAAPAKKFRRRLSATTCFDLETAVVEAPQCTALERCSVRVGRCSCQHRPNNLNFATGPLGFEVA